MATQKRKVRAFATEYVWAKITEVNGRDISATPIKLAIKGVRAGPPVEDDWRNPDNNVVVAPTIRRVAYLVGRGTPVYEVGAYNLWWRASDHPESPGELAGQFQII